jgi:hypothetical protein
MITRGFRFSYFNVVSTRAPSFLPKEFTTEWRKVRRVYYAGVDLLQISNFCAVVGRLRDSWKLTYKRYIVCKNNKKYENIVGDSKRNELSQRKFHVQLWWSLVRYMRFMGYIRGSQAVVHPPPPQGTLLVLWGARVVRMRDIYFERNMGARQTIYFGRQFACLKYFTYHLLLVAVLAPNYK